MKRDLLIAEKPSQMRNIEKVYNKWIVRIRLILHLGHVGYTRLLV